MIKFYDFVLAQLIAAMKRKVIKLDLMAARDFDTRMVLLQAAEAAKMSACLHLQAAVDLEARAEKLESL